MITILDCYTDEPAGLGVPPYLGTYPRYIAGLQKEIPTYITIDDLRLLKKYNSIVPNKTDEIKTDITVYNLTANYQKIRQILEQTTELIIIVGVHTPGKYLSAIPGTIHEIKRLLEDFQGTKILTGPAAFGTQMQGGKWTEKVDDPFFHEIKKYDLTYANIQQASIRGAQILDQIPDERVLEIEASVGCTRTPGCSFCLEPIKSCYQERPYKWVLEEVKALHKKGARHFRVGKQSCIYAYKDLIPLLKGIRDIGEIKTLHVDNANPQNVVHDKGHEKTKALVKYCTEGNVAAFGVESFDPKVVKLNNLNSDPDMTIEAIRIINKYGAERGPNGMPKFLPGLNLIFGLIGENKNSFEENYGRLNQIMEEKLLLRRINIRKVVPFPGTPLFEKAGNKYLRKNNRYYYGWRKKIRENIDHLMLKKVAPKNTIMHDVIPEIYDGNTTFGRQIGTYPLIIGIKGRIPLQKPVSVKVTGYMLRSLMGEVVE